MFLSRLGLWQVLGRLLVVNSPTNTGMARERITRVNKNKEFFLANG